MRAWQFHMKADISNKLECFIIFIKIVHRHKENYNLVIFLIYTYHLKIYMMCAINDDLLKSFKNNIN